LGLLPNKIKVIAKLPGTVDKEFSLVRFKGDDTKAKAVYEGYEPLHATDIADACYYCATLPAHVCINDQSRLERNKNALQGRNIGC